MVHYSDVSRANINYNIVFSRKNVTRVSKYIYEIVHCEFTVSKFEFTAAIGTRVLHKISLNILSQIHSNIRFYPFLYSDKLPVFGVRSLMPLIIKLPADLHTNHSYSLEPSSTSQHAKRLVPIVCQVGI